MVVFRGNMWLSVPQATRSLRPSNADLFDGAQVLDKALSLCSLLALPASRTAPLRRLLLPGHGKPISLAATSNLSR